MKPAVFLWSLGEEKFHQVLAKGLSAKKEDTDLSVESEQRVYQITSRLGELQTPTGAILTYGATQTITPKLKSILLFASRYVSELVVLLVGCEEIKTERALDSIESNLRRNLSECGFDGNSAAILRVSKGALNKTNVKALLAALDEKNLTIEPRAELTKLPEKHPNTLLADMMLQARALVRASGRVSLTFRGNLELLQGPITTQFGGIPYLEEGESFPACKKCKKQMTYLFQLDARNHLQPPIPKAGLYVFYECIEPSHPPFSQLTARHYPAPSPERRQKDSSALDLNASLDAFEAQVRCVSELPSLYHESLLPAIWKKLDKLTPKKNASAWLNEIIKILGVESAAFDDDGVGRIAFGGYAAASEGYSTTIPICKKCKKEMRLLASVGYNPQLGFSDDLRVADLQFFVCACRPSAVETIVITLDDDYMMSERYEVFFE